MNGNYNRLLTDTPLSCKGWAMFDIATQQLLPRVQRVPYRKLGNSIWSEKSLLPHMTHKIQIVELLSELQRISQIINHLSVIFFFISELPEKSLLPTTTWKTVKQMHSKSQNILFWQQSKHDHAAHHMVTKPINKVIPETNECYECFHSCLISVLSGPKRS